MVDAIYLLAGSLSATAGLATLGYVRRSRRQRGLRGLARRHRLQWSSIDRFDLLPRMRELLGPRRSAELQISDVLYGRRGERRLFCFTVRWQAASLSDRRSDVHLAVVQESLERDSRIELLSFEPMAAIHLTAYENALASLASLAADGGGQSTMG